MIDKIEYKTNGEKLEKVITGNLDEINIKEEIRVLEAQLEDFKLGQEREYSDVIAAAIVNYEEQIAYLKGK